MLGALLWGIGASMALAEENEKAKTMSVEKQLEKAKTIIQDLYVYNVAGVITVSLRWQNERL